MAFRGCFHVERLDDERGALALELIQEGHLVVLAGLGLRCVDSALIVTVASAWSDPKQVTAAVVAEELERGTARWLSIVGADAAVSELAATRSLRLELVVDYETGSVLIAELDLPSPGSPTGSR